MGAQSIEAGKAFLKLMVEDSTFKRGLDQALRKVEGFRGGLKTASIAVGAAGAAITAPFVASLKVFSEFGSGLNDMAQRTGVAVSMLSQLKFAAEQSGAEFGDVEKALRQMAKNGLDPNSFFEVAKSIAAIEDPTQRVQAAIAAWGKTGTRLLPMIGDLETLRQTSERLGLVWDDKMAKSADELGDSIDTAKASLTAIAAAIGAQVAPHVTKFINLITDNTKVIVDWIKEHGELVVAIGAFGLALTAAAAVLATATVTVGALAAAITALATPVGVMVLGVIAMGAEVAIVTSYFIDWKAAIEGVNKALSESFAYVRAMSQLGKMFSDPWGAIQDNYKGGTAAPKSSRGAMSQSAKDFWKSQSQSYSWGVFPGLFGPSLMGMMGQFMPQLSQERARRRGLSGFSSPPQSFAELQSNFQRSTLNGRMASQIFGSGTTNQQTSLLTKNNQQNEKKIKLLEDLKRNTDKLKSLGPIRFGLA